MKIQTLLRSRASLRPVSSADISVPVKSSVCICVIGVGYVGRSLVTEFGKHFFTIGYDISEERIQTLQDELPDRTQILLTTDPSHLGRGTHYLIAVPTPLKDKSPDRRYLEIAIQTVAMHAMAGSTIVIESTVAVGTTREILGPYKDRFHGGMSPERINPGQVSPLPHQIPKVISGLTPKALKSIAGIYGQVYKTIVPVSRPEVAEMTKLYENCYRMVNIAYVNEVSDACLSHGIDPHEMIGAAATKPFGFQPFYPGLGVGGHCIPVNPFYLFQNNSRMKVLELATNLMLQRPAQQASRFYRKTLRTAKHALGQPRILVVGLGFKAGHSGSCGSPAIHFSERLFELGCARLAFFEPSKTGDEISWMERLGGDCWTSTYIDANFDAVAVCNLQFDIDLSILDLLRKAVVRRYF